MDISPLLSLESNRVIQVRWVSKNYNGFMLSVHVCFSICNTKRPRASRMVPECPVRESSLGKRLLGGINGVTHGRHGVGYLAPQ